MSLEAGVTVLDLSLFLSNDLKKRESFINQLRRACVVDGVFYVSNHGIDTTLCSEFMTIISEFFHLSEDEKDTIAFVKSPHWRGYAPLGAETTARRQDVREQIEFGLEATCPDPHAVPAYLRLQGPNQWPSKTGHVEWGVRFRRVTEEYVQQLLLLSETLLEAMEVAVGVTKGNMMKFFQPLPHVRMKLVRCVSPLRKFLFPPHRTTRLKSQ